MTGPYVMPSTTHLTAAQGRGGGANSVGFRAYVSIPAALIMVPGINTTHHWRKYFSNGRGKRVDR